MAGLTAEFAGFVAPWPEQLGDVAFFVRTIEVPNLDEPSLKRIG
jgi:hypothetical protein